MLTRWRNTQYVRVLLYVGSIFQRDMNIILFMLHHWHNALGMGAHRCLWVAPAAGRPAYGLQQEAACAAAESHCIASGATLEDIQKVRPNQGLKHLQRARLFQSSNKLHGKIGEGLHSTSFLKMNLTEQNQTASMVPVYAGALFYRGAGLYRVEAGELLHTNE